MEIVAIYKNTEIACAFDLLGQNPSINFAQIHAAITQLLQCKSKTIINSKSNSIISFCSCSDHASTDNIIYISQMEKPTQMIRLYLKSIKRLYSTIKGGRFIRQLHCNGRLHDSNYFSLHTIFLAPRVYPQTTNSTLNNFITDISSKCRSSCYALYSQYRILEASEAYWNLDNYLLHSIDSVVRLNEAPFSCQIMKERKGGDHHVYMCRIYKTLYFVVLDSPSDLNSFMISISNVVHEKMHKDFIKLIVSEPEILKSEPFLAWVIYDEAIPRFMESCPNRYERDFIDAICKSKDITYDNRITDMQFRVHEYNFFYFPRVKVKVSLIQQNAQFWSFYGFFQSQITNDELRNFAMNLMKAHFGYVKAIPNARIPDERDFNRFNFW